MGDVRVERVSRDKNGFLSGPRTHQRAQRRGNRAATNRGRGAGRSRTNCQTHEQTTKQTGPEDRPGSLSEPPEGGMVFRNPSGESPLPVPFLLF